MQRERFAELVVKAIKELPAEFQEKLENIDVVVEDLPSKRQLRKVRLREPQQLLGLYEGIPKTIRGTNYNLVLPDKITLFQQSIELECKSEREIEVEIGEVIRHEIAHYFGISDSTLRKIEKQRSRSKRNK